MVVLGSTGSIGTNTLEIARRFRLPVEALVAGHNTERLQRQIDEFAPSMVGVATKEGAARLNHPNIFVGETAIETILNESRSEMVVNALVGFLGLRPTVTAVSLGKTVALANKESLVAAGAFIDIDKLRPIDSEHFGLWYLLNGRKPKRMVITASGGAFRSWPAEKIAAATYKEALCHPNWSMGDKITIDSATMTNKIFELLEAYWFFGCAHVDAVIESKSVVHALIEFQDGATTAQLANPDMKLPISYALVGHHDKPLLTSVDLLGLGGIEFKEIETLRYPIWGIRQELLAHPKRGVVVNAANEIAINRFRQGEIGFFDMSRLVMEAFEHFAGDEPQSIDDVFAIDREVRAWSAEEVV